MKSIIVVSILCCLLPIMAIAQTKQVATEVNPPPATKIEGFLSKKGTLFIKEFHSTSSVNGQFGSKIDIASLIAYEPGKTSGTIRGVRITVQEGGRRESSHVSFLDLDEAESLSKALAYIITLVEKFKLLDQEYVEVVFTTKDGFDLGFFQRGKEFTAVAKSGTVGRTTSFIDIQELTPLKNSIDEAIASAKK